MKLPPCFVQPSLAAMALTWARMSGDSTSSPSFSQTATHSALPPLRSDFGQDVQKSEKPAEGTIGFFFLLSSSTLVVVLSASDADTCPPSCPLASHDPRALLSDFLDSAVRLVSMARRFA